MVVVRNNRGETTHKLAIRYNGNSGTWNASSSSSYDADSSKNVIVKSTGEIYEQVSYYGELINHNSGLMNWDSSSNISFTRSGYSVTGDIEWYLSTDSSKEYSDSAVNYTATGMASDVGCDLSTTDCTITLKVNWKKN